MIEKVIILVCAIITLLAIWELVSYVLWGSREERRNSARDTIVGAKHAVQSAAAAPVVESEAKPKPSMKPDDFIVKEIMDGKATLMMRHRSHRGNCTAHLIVWSGDKKRRIQDSYYDLGFVTAEGLTTEVIDEFQTHAVQHISDIANKGKAKRRARRKESKQVVEAVAEGVQASNPIQAAAPVAVEVEENTPQAPIKIKRFPSVYRGTILEMGMMTQSKNGEEFKTYGVRYRTPEGVEDAVYGVQLRDSLREAKAGVGDLVEILKIGRKTVESGKAPMNLFTVAKLEATSL